MSIQIAVAGSGSAVARAPELRRVEHPAVREPVAPPPENTSRKVVETKAAELERVSSALNRKLKFVVDYESRNVTVKVIDPETDKVIKILPPEELQRLHSKIQETIGFLFDERV